MDKDNITGDGQPPQLSRRSNPQFVRNVQLVSRVITLIFIVAIIVAIYQAVVQGNPLPLWAWIGTIALLAAVIGLAVAVVLYRGVSKKTGPFDFGAATRELEQRRGGVDEAEGDPEPAEDHDDQARQ